MAGRTYQIDCIRSIEQDHGSNKFLVMCQSKALHMILHAESNVVRHARRTEQVYYRTTGNH